MSWLQENWPIVMGFTGGVVAWGRTVTTVQRTVKDVETLSARVTATERDIGEIKASTARIEAYQEGTQQRLDDLIGHLRGK